MGLKMTNWHTSRRVLHAVNKHYRDVTIQEKVLNYLSIALVKDVNEPGRDNVPEND